MKRRDAIRWADSEGYMASQKASARARMRSLSPLVYMTLAVGGIR